MRPPTTWTTSDGTKVRIRDMSDSHLINTLRYVERHAPLYRAQAAAGAWSFACMLNGEEASAQAENVAESIEDGDFDDDVLADAVPAFPVMVKEAERRKLNWMWES